MLLSPVTRRLGLFSAVVFVALSGLYATVTVIGLLSLRTPDDPIADPWFTAMEVLILLLMPVLVALVVAVHEAARSQLRSVALAALAFAGMLGGLTSAVHFSVLVLSRSPQFSSQPMAALLVSFRWPSLAYVLDILAWDVFFPLLAFCLAALFGGDRLGRAIRLLLVVSGLLALAGLTGIPGGNMQLRNIGIAGYAVIFPIATALMALWFARRQIG